jgi:adenylate cyclase
MNSAAVDSPSGPAPARRPISLKIFSIAVGMLVFMAIATGISTLNLRKVNNIVRVLSEYYIPLEQRTAQIDIKLRGEIIHLEKLLLLLQLKRADAGAIEAELGLFEQRGDEVEQQVLAAAGLVEQGLARTDIQIDRLEFSLLSKELPDIIQAHKHLRKTVVQYLKEIRGGNAHAIDLLHEAIQQERASVDKEVRDVTTELRKLSSTSADEAAALEQKAFLANWSITAVAAVLGLLFAAFITRNLVRPVRELLAGTKAVEQGDLSIHIRIQSADEIASLADSFNHMVSELQQKEVIKETFGKYVDPRIVKGLIEDKHFAQVGEKRRMSVFFSDLEGFTALSEQLTPDGVVRILNSYFTLMSGPIRAHNGIIDKYIGDGIMAFWGPPFTAEGEHARLACLSALEQISLLERFHESLPEVMGIRKGIPRLRMRIGISTGDVTVGNIGSESSRGYTVIGDAVNLASRLESANKEYDTRILLSEATRELVRDTMQTRELDLIRVVGKQEPVRVFELLGQAGRDIALSAEFREGFAAALAAYRARSWDRAQALFEECLRRSPDDQATALYLARLEHFRTKPPAPDWDGVWSLARK